MKRIYAFIAALGIVLSLSFPAVSDTIVGEGPQEIVEDTASYITVNSSGAVISGAPSGLGTGGDSVSSGISTVGADHAADETFSVDLGFTVVSPAVSYGEFKVAEGSVLLNSGSWDTIGYDRYLRAGYYKLIREVRDRSGVDWYVVEAHASSLGDYSTPDGTVVTELWLKKSDCTATASVNVNTSDTTRQNIVRTALSLLGKAYRYGGSGPDAFDCSGFVTYVLSQNGITGLPRTSTELCSAGTEVGIRGLLPGDIVGRPGHVGIYIGDGWFVHSSQSVTGVICERVDVYNRNTPFTSYRSVVD